MQHEGWVPRDAGMLMKVIREVAFEAVLVHLHKQANLFEILRLLAVHADGMRKQGRRGGRKGRKQ